MRRLGEVSIDGVVDFTDGQQFRPVRPIELEMSLGNAGSARGFLALLRAFSNVIETTPEAGRMALRGLIAAEQRWPDFERVLVDAEAQESACGGGRPARLD